MREVKALENKVKTLGKDLSLHKPLAEIKTILWANIGQSITDQWRSIQTIHEKIDLIEMGQVEIQKARALLGNMPEQANRLINFLNTQNKEELAALDIRDSISTILTVKKVLTMRNFIQNLERKCQEIQIEINAFTEKFTVLQEKGLPSLLTSDHRLLTHTQYAHRVNTYVSNQITASSSTSEEKELPFGQTLYDNLKNMFYIEHEIRHLFAVHPNFFRYTEADEILIKLQRHQLPGEQWWQRVLEVL